MFWNTKKFTTCENVRLAEEEFNRFKTLVEGHTGKIVKVVGLRGGYRKCRIGVMVL